MNVARLQALAARLDVLPAAKFDISKLETAETCCTMCVAMNMPEFNLVGYVARAGMLDGERIPEFRGQIVHMAFAEFFGLPLAVTRGLCGMDYKMFGLSYMCTPRDVAAVLRKIAAKHDERQSEAVTESSAKEVVNA